MMGSQFLKWFGLLSLVLILVAYYKGSVPVLGALAGMVQTISYAWTGRNAQGNFANYPQ